MKGLEKVLADSLNKLAEQDGYFEKEPVIKVIKKKESKYEIRKVYYRVEFNNSEMRVEGSRLTEGTDETAVVKVLAEVRREFECNKNVHSISGSLLPHKEWDI